MDSKHTTITLSSFCETIKNSPSILFTKPKELYYTIIPRSFAHFSYEPNLEYGDDNQVIGLEFGYFNGLLKLIFKTESDMLIDEETGSKKRNSFNADGLYREVIRLVTIYYNNRFADLESVIETVLCQNDFDALKDKFSTLLNEYQNINHDLSDKQATVLILLHCFYRNCIPYRIRQVQHDRIEIFNTNQPKNIDKADSYETRFNRDFNGSLSPDYIIKKLVNLYLNIDDSQSKEKPSIYRSEKYTPSSDEEKKTHNSFMLCYEVFLEYVEDFRKEKKITKERLDFIDRFVERYPEPDYKLLADYVYISLKENDYEKNNGRR